MNNMEKTLNIKVKGQTIKETKEVSYSVDKIREEILNIKIDIDRITRETNRVLQGLNRKLLEKRALIKDVPVVKPKVIHKTPIAEVDKIVL